MYTSFEIKATFSMKKSFIQPLKTSDSTIWNPFQTGLAPSSINLFGPADKSDVMGRELHRYLFRDQVHVRPYSSFRFYLRIR